MKISIGNSMICSDNFKIVIRNFTSRWASEFETILKYHAQIMLLFVYTTTHKRFVIFTCRYFKLS